MNKYEKVNNAMWDELTDVHFKSYGVDKFKSGISTLDEIQIREIGSVDGKSMLHLQCHFGLDSLSWAREGAIVTGIDFVQKAIAYANGLRDELNLKARFICCNIYDLEKHLNEQFDFVYTSQGVLCWLKDIKEWGNLIARYLKPGGIFYMMESHPITHIFEDTIKGELRIIHPYFHDDIPTKWDDAYPDYSDPTYIKKNPSYEWKWTISDIVNALIEAGLRIEFINEYNRTFCKLLPDMVHREDGWWYLPGYEKRLPLVFTIRARK